MKKCVLRLLLVTLGGLLAMPVSAANVDINGTSTGDQIAVGDLVCETQIFPFVHYYGIHVYKNGATTALSASSGDVIRIFGNGGGDHLEAVSTAKGDIYTGVGNCRLTPVTSVNVTFVLYGGDGGDFMYGSDGGDHLLGEDGWDKIYGHGGDDFLTGGDDQDEIYGGDGTDHISGHRSAGLGGCFDDDGDACFGEGGNDYIWCDAVAHGGSGTDGCYADYVYSCGGGGLPYQCIEG